MFFKITTKIAQSYIVKYDGYRFKVTVLNIYTTLSVVLQQSISK